jgi:subtilisin family serine protease
VVGREDPNDACADHGTHCASTVGGGTYGVAKETTIIAVQVLGCSGSGAKSDTIAGMEWAVADALASGVPSVLSMSLGGGFSEAQNQAVAQAVADNVMVIAAAGNENEDACRSSPAAAPAAITVGATMEPSPTGGTDQRSSFSNYGRCVDVFAPGSDIAAAVSSSDSAVELKSGTSMATPHVAGAAAQLRATYPSLSAAEATEALLCLATPDVVTDTMGSPNLFLYADLPRLPHPITAFTIAPRPPHYKTPRLGPTLVRPLSSDRGSVAPR